MNDIIKSPVISVQVYDVKSPMHSMIEVKGRPFYAITYRKSGAATVSMNGKIVVSKKNCVTFTPKNQSYLTEITEDTHIIAVHFDCLGDSSFDTPFVFENTNYRIREIFEMLYNEYSVGKGLDFKCFSLFYELLEEIKNHIRLGAESKINPKILRAKQEIENCFSDNDFNISKLADVLCISTSYLRHEFRRVYHISPISYLQNIRIKKAEAMLLSDYYSIEDIARECGYASASYFIQVFHNKKGCSPLKYKGKSL